MPFSFEGKKRKYNAIQGIDTFCENVDYLLIINNDSLDSDHSAKSSSMLSLFHNSDRKVAGAVSDIVEALNKVESSV